MSREEELLTLEEVAGLLRVSVRQLRRWKSLGLLEVTLLGGSRRYPRVTRAAYQSFINNSRQRRRCPSKKTPS